MNKMTSPTLAATVEGYNKGNENKPNRKAVIQTVKVLPPLPTVTVMLSAKTEGIAAVAKRARAEANFIFAQINKRTIVEYKGDNMNRESWRFSSVLMREARKLEIGAHPARRQIADKRPATGAWGGGEKKKRPTVSGAGP